jgi:hypothetical protein
MAANRRKHLATGSKNKMPQNHRAGIDGAETMKHERDGWAPHFKGAIYPTDARATANQSQK